MKIVLSCNVETIRKYILEKGYIKRKHGNGYIKDVKAGRLHMSLNQFEQKTVMILHYDKYKHNRKKKLHHSTRYDHPYVRKEIKAIIEDFKKC